MGAWIEIESIQGINSISSYVAPFMGAWIEICFFQIFSGNLSLSHPLWVRGLKLVLPPLTLVGLQVAPFMGAWIEIVSPAAMLSKSKGRTLYGCVD